MVTLSLSQSLSLWLSLSLSLPQLLSLGTEEDFCSETEEESPSIRPRLLHRLALNIGLSPVLIINSRLPPPQLRSYSKAGDCYFLELKSMPVDIATHQHHTRTCGCQLSRSDPGR